MRVGQQISGVGISPVRHRRISGDTITLSTNALRDTGQTVTVIDQTPPYDTSSPA